MTQEDYDALLAGFADGRGVTIEGRTAIDQEQLDFALRASGDTVPGHGEAVVPGDPEPDEQPQQNEQPQQDEQPETAILFLPTLDGPTRVLLVSNGFDSVEKVAETDDAALLAISGIGANRLANIRQAVEMAQGS